MGRPASFSSRIPERSTMSTAPADGAGRRRPRRIEGRSSRAVARTATLWMGRPAPAIWRSGANGRERPSSSATSIVFPAARDGSAGRIRTGVRPVKAAAFRRRTPIRSSGRPDRLHGVPSADQPQSADAWPRIRDRVRVEPWWSVRPRHGARRSRLGRPHDPRFPTEARGGHVGPAHAHDTGAVVWLG